MISTNPTKCQLSNDDLTEYETTKSTWKKDPQSVTNKKHNDKQTQQQHRTNVNTRIGVTYNK